jgi:hypothetical protein
MTVAYKKETVAYGDNRYVVERWSQASAADAVQTCSTDPAGVASGRAPAQHRMLVGVFVTYSGSVAKAVTVTLNSGLGAAYDVLLNTITTVAGQGQYIPAGPIEVFADDVVDVAAAAGGGGITSQVIIVTTLTEL